MTKQKSRSHTILPDRKASLFAEHLPYELRMLRFTYRRLAGGIDDDDLRNALIESFSIHARNLTDFFKSKADLLPQWFTTDGYRPGKPYEDKLYERLSNQITHLSQKRAQRDEPKLDDVDRLTIYKGLEDQITAFINALTPEYRARFTDQPVDTAKLEPGTPSTTNSIVIAGTKPLKG